MKTKSVVLFLAVLLVAAAVAPAAENLRAGEAAIYKIGGFVVIDRIDDISIKRHVLETANNGPIPLQNIWMINFVTDEWNFPQERAQVTTNDHYIFMKTGAVSTGRIVDFSSARRWFEFDNGQKFPIAEVRRIYFSKTLPPGLAAQLEKKPVPQPAPVPKPAPEPPTFVGVYEKIDGEKVHRLDLLEDKTVQLTVPRFPKAPVISHDLTRTLTGVWEATGDNQVTIKLTPSEESRIFIVYVFNREGNDLVATGDFKETYGDLRLTKR